MEKKNYISTDGNGNIILQDIKANNININDIKAIKQLFETTEPEYIKQLFKQIDDNYKQLVQQNDKQIAKVIALLQHEIDNRGIKIAESKNILSNSSISNIGRDVHIGDVIYQNSSQKSNKILLWSLLVAFILIIVFLMFNQNIFSKIIDPQIDIDTSNSDYEPPIFSVDTSKSDVILIDTVTEPTNNIPIAPPIQTLSLKITTSKGTSPVFVEDEKVQIFFTVNKACYVRIIYKMADGSAVLLADNLQVKSSDINKQLSPPYSFTCAEPFGDELLNVYAQQQPFEALQTELKYGYEFITQPLTDAFAISEKGLKKNIEFVKKSINVKTNPTGF
ncbi:MAG: hypothetical protein U9Q83_09305 [Bacteroidota bacterium]|nr:hypothetical protein [Bacteroidota bacterium]